MDKELNEILEYYGANLDNSGEPEEDNPRRSESAKFQLHASGRRTVLPRELPDVQARPSAVSGEPSEGHGESPGRLPSCNQCADGRLR